MDEESEKIMVLKKVYAEIILNTAKEAAARIMASERKTHEYQHGLSSTKDEALRLLLRLKQTMDCKNNEVEMRSQDQQRKIEELEAQLEEAEDIVSNLRAELNEAHMKLDELEDNQICTGTNLMVKAVAVNGSSLQPVNTEAVVVTQAERLSNGAHGHSSVNSSFKEYGYSEEPEVPSIIIKRKERELYRNGCTQRIRACDGNLLKGHLSTAGGLDQLKNVEVSRESEEGERISVKTPVVADIVCVEEQKSIDIKEVEDDESVDLMQYLKLLRTRRTGASKYKKNNASSLKHVSHVVKETCSDLSTSHAGVPGSYDIDESDNKDKVRQSNSPSTAPSSVFDIGALQENVFSIQNDGKLTKARADGVNKNREVSSSLAITTQQSTSRISLQALESDTELEMKSCSSLNLDDKLLDTSDELESSLKDRLLKYTFQRKRKKDYAVTDDSDLLLEESPLRKKIVMNQNGNLKPVKSSEVTESP